MQDYFEKMQEAFAKLPTYVILLGIFKGDPKDIRDIYKNKKNTHIKDTKIDNAEILFIAENGSKVRHIPKRPVLKITLSWAIKKGLLDTTYKKAIKAFIDSGFNEQAIEKELKKCCIQIESYARTMINDNDPRLARNAKSTIEAKGFDHPLWQTGQLAKSIRCIYIKK